MATHRLLNKAYFCVNKEGRIWGGGELRLCCYFLELDILENRDKLKNRMFLVLAFSGWEPTWGNKYIVKSSLPVALKHIFSSVTQWCPTLCNPMNHSTPGLPVHHQLPEFTQTHVHRVSDAIQPSHPLSSTSPPAPNPSQHQSLFQ